MQAASKPTTPTRLVTRTVPLKSLKVDEGRFSPRRYEGDGAKSGLARADSARHAKDLGDALNHGAKFDPLLVWQDSDGQLWIVDGFHQYRAYKGAGKAKVPVRVLPADTTEDQARYMAFEANHRNKLPLTKGQRMEAVWRFIAMRNSVVDKTPTRLAGEILGVGKSTISRMRGVQKRLEEAGDLPADADDIPTWWQASNRDWGTEDRDEAREHELEERKVNELADAFEAAIRLNWTDDKSLLNQAFGQAMERLHPGWYDGEGDEDTDSEDY